MRQHTRTLISHRLIRHEAHRLRRTDDCSAFVLREDVGEEEGAGDVGDGVGGGRSGGSGGERDCGGSAREEEGGVVVRGETLGAGSGLNCVVM